jgi:hypothetical protein
MDKSTLFAPACRSKTGAIRAKDGRGISREDGRPAIEKCMMKARAFWESCCEHRGFSTGKRKIHRHKRALLDSALPQEENQAPCKCEQGNISSLFFPCEAPESNPRFSPNLLLLASGLIGSP